MRVSNFFIGGVAAAFLAVLAIPASASRVAVNPTQVGAAFAAPYVTGTADGDVVTAIVITNASGEATTLQLFVLNGDPDGDWEERSLDCYLTAHETTVLTIVGDGDGADLAIECSAPGSSSGTPAQLLSLVTERNLPGRRGIVFVAQKELEHLVGNDLENGVTVGDVLIADWTAIDFAAGLAYSAEALHFQNAGGGIRGFNFRFDNDELTAFPSAVASNFIAPDCTDPADPSTCDVDVELLLFTLDGRPGDPPPQEARLDFYNDDERLLDNVDIPFECLDIVRLVDLDEDFNAVDLCEVAPLGCVGHFALTPQRVDVFTGHDNPSNGDGNGGAYEDNERLSAFHGWIIHRFGAGATVLTFDGPAGTGMAGDAATARLLLSGPNSNVGIGGDTPAFDAR